MQTEVHVSIDLETLSTRPDAVITSIGAAAQFVDNSGKKVTSKFLCFVNIEDQADRHTDPKTLEWWQKNKVLYDDMIERCASGSTLDDALINFRTWYASLGDDQCLLFPWGNGATFDISILEHAFKSRVSSPPWAYWQPRDIRTLKYLAERQGKVIPMNRDKGTHHQADDDAKNQLDFVLANLDLFDK